MLQVASPLPATAEDVHVQRNAAACGAVSNGKKFQKNFRGPSVQILLRKVVLNMKPPKAPGLAPWHSVLILPFLRHGASKIEK
jgi:hypothetical protein